MRYFPLLTVIVAAALWTVLTPLSARAASSVRKDYLSGEKLLLIGVGSAVPMLLSHVVRHVDSAQASIIPRPILADRWLQKRLGGDFYVGKKNFLAGNIGSAITPGVCGLAMIIADFTWPAEKPAKDAGQDFLVFHSGLMATKGMTGLVKGLVARPRPFLYFSPDSALRHDSDHSDSRKSFFSGHTSGAFYSSTFLNKRLRDIMRRRLSGGNYSDWKLVPPVVLFGWSSYVGLSRIRAYDHYFSDVVVGAVAGYLLAELFYSLGDKYSSEAGTTGAVSRIFHLSFEF